MFSCSNVVRNVSAEPFRTISFVGSVKFTASTLSDDNDGLSGSTGASSSGGGSGTFLGNSGKGGTGITFRKTVFFCVLDMTDGEADALDRTDAVVRTDDKLGDFLIDFALGGADEGTESFDTFVGVTDDLLTVLKRFARGVVGFTPVVFVFAVRTLEALATEATEFVALRNAEVLLATTAAKLAVC